MSTYIEILNIKEVGEPTRPYDFHIDENSSVGKIFINVNDKTKIKSIFKEKIDSKDYAVNLYLTFMITAYKEFGHLRLFCGDINQVCYGEIIKEWLENKIL